MSSIIRPTAAQMIRRLIVLASAIFAVLAGQLQMLLGLGQTAAEFAADSDETLRVAGYAFAIWGIIYLGILAYAIRQVLPQTGESDLIRALGWPSASAFVGIGLWIVAAATDWELGTNLLIFGSAIVLIAPLLIYAPQIRALPRMDRDRWFTAWPIGLLAGWLTIASPVNLITVATGNGDLPPALSPTAWAMFAVVLVSALALIVTWRTRLLAFALPISWGLLGAFVAEQARNPTLAFSALGAALVVLLGSLVLVFQLRRDVGR